MLTNFKLKVCMYKDHLYPVNKKEYIKNKRKKEHDPNKCILCSVRDGKDDVKSLEVYRERNFIITVNLYPYNPGHIMIFPEKHVEDIRELSKKERKILDELTVLSINVLEKVYEPDGFNIGINMGKGSGASIKHLHKHIVPRYQNELGFIDIVGGSKIYIEEPGETLKKLIDGFKKYNK